MIPKCLTGRIVAWYHKYLAHPGQTRMEATIRQTMYWPNIRQDVEKTVRTCRVCQIYKGPSKKYGHLPLKQAENPIPWNRVHVDMIGPLTVKTAKGKHELRALTMIDPVTGWFEVKDVKKADSDSCMRAMDDVWLSRYPRPEYLGFDGGSEFKSVFKQMRINYGMKKQPSAAYNPQANGIVEQVHQVLNKNLKTFELTEKELDSRDPFSELLASAAFAIRSTVHTTLGATPGQLVFGRVMLLPIKFPAELAVIHIRRQDMMKKKNEKENMKRIPHQSTK